VASLSSVHVPQDAIPVLKRLAELDEPRAEALVEAMSSGSAHERASLENAAEAVLGDGWTRNDVKSLVSNLISMSMLGTSHGFNTTELAKALARKATEGPRKAEAESLDPSNRDILSARLAALLEAPDLVAFSKAVDIFTESDRSLHLSRILTDIRPVFGSGSSPELLGALIVHSLKLDYHHSGRLQTVTFALDAIDLAELKQAIARAEEKARTLAAMLDETGLAMFDVAKVEDD
jgi:hypothetical protein